ncbi:MgtC/SapB family protein [Methylobacterium sp. DB0501]|nr:MgtC/SapB family protein [Methylobacterium sp. DB0501]
MPDATAFTLSAVVAHLGAATLCGLGLVASRAAVIATSALGLHAVVRREGGNADRLRVIQGLAQAIGFISAGTIVVARRNVKNLTTAASLRFAASAGIVAGAAQFTLPAVAMGFGGVVLIALRQLARLGLAPAEDRQES